MKHIHLSENWKYTEEPFPAFRCWLIYGRNKRDFGFLPSKVEPGKVWAVVDGQIEVYRADTREQAEEYVKKSAGNYYWKVEPVWTELPEGRFRVIKTKDKGTILIVPGEERTDRALVFVGARGDGGPGNADLIREATTANVIAVVSAASNCDSGIEIAAIFEKGQRVVFRGTSRWYDGVTEYIYTGDTVNKKEYSYGEWSVANSDSEGEEI